MSQGIDRNIQSSRFRRGRVMQACPDKLCTRKGGLGPRSLFYRLWVLSLLLSLCYVGIIVLLGLLDKCRPAAAHVKVHSWWSESRMGSLCGSEVQLQLSCWPRMKFTPCVWRQRQTWFLCRCLGWPALSNPPHVWTLCAVFELMFPCCNLCFFC